MPWKSGDFAEVFLEDRSVSSIGMSGKVENFNRGKDYGIGIRIIQGQQMVYAYTNDMSENNLTMLLKMQAELFRRASGFGVEFSERSES